MKNTTAASFAALVVAAAIAGCAGGNYATAVSTPSPAPTPTVACTSPPGSSFQLLFPAPGPTVSGIVTNNQGVLVAVAPTALPTNWYGYVSSAAFGVALGDPPAFLTTVLPSPAPTPTATPLIPNATVEYFPFGIFATGNTWTVFLANSNCFPGIAIPGGTFQS